MVIDVDDFHEDNHRLDLLHELRRINPKFRCTLFAVPDRGSDEFWASVPAWCELILHGWRHDHVDECIDWTYERTLKALRERPPFFGRGWKSPGWQTSDGVYAALVEERFWVADQHLEDERRPADLPTYFYEDSPDRIHLHVQDVCGNGLNESWDWLVERVASATEFRFCSESLSFGSNAHHQGQREVSA